MLPLKSSSRFQPVLGPTAFGATGAEVFGILPANLDVPIDMLRGFLAVTRGMVWLGANGKEDVAANCIVCIMID